MSTLSSALQRAYQEEPDRIAIHLQLTESSVPVSYRDLFHGACGYSHELRKAGINPGEVVVIILQHGLDLVTSFFGAILQGAIPAIMPFLTEKLLPDRYRQSLVSLMEITRPTAIVTYPEFMGEIRQTVGPGASVRAAISSDQASPLRSVDLENLPGLRATPEDIVLLQHSSGTTGLQKGVALSHRAVLNQVTQYSKAIRMTEADVVVSWLPLYHDMGLIAGFIMPILLRTSLVLLSPFDWVRAPHRLMRAVSDYRGTLSWLPNFAYNFCAQKIRDRDLEGVDLSTWRAVINCSEPLRHGSHRMFVERFRPHGLKPEALATCYAMAENVFAVTQGGIEGPVVEDVIDLRAFQEEKKATPSFGGDHSVVMLSAGKPIENTQVRVLDDERQLLPDRRLGEIAIQSDCMLTGYFNRGDLTERAFHEGWYLTGDLGYLADGELYVSGRKKELIIVGGKNIYPQDLEELAERVEGVHPGRVVAFGIFNEDIGTEEVIIVAEADNKDPEQRERIAREIRARVTQGSEVTPRYVRVVDRKWLLKTSSGKIGRSLNSEKYLAEFGGPSKPR